MIRLRYNDRGELEPVTWDHHVVLIAAPAEPPLRVLPPVKLTRAERRRRARAGLKRRMGARRVKPGALQLSDDRFFVSTITYQAYLFRGGLNGRRSEVLLYLPEGRTPNATDGPAIDAYLRGRAV